MTFSRLMVFGLLLFAAYTGWTKFQHRRAAEQRLTEVIANNSELKKVDDALKQQQPYVAVYGRDSCGYTSHLRQQLDRAGVRYRYFSVDDKNAAYYLHQRMAAHKLDASYYELPVIDQGNQMTIRPEPADLIESLR